MKYLKKSVHFISIITYFLIFMYIIVLVPIIFGFHPLVVLSGSMEPTLKVGSIVYYRKVPENNLKEGDIITYNLNNQVVSHRIVKIEDNLYTTKGDANSSVDVQRISYENIIGKDLNFSIPFIGYFIGMINNNLYIMIILITILVIEFILRRRNLYEK